MKKIRKIFMAMIMIVAIVTTNIPYQTNAAGVAAHTHDANCYIGTIHSAHVSSCYTSRQVQAPCGGVFRTYNTIYDYAPTPYYYIAYCGNPDCIRYGFRNGGEPTNQYIYKEMCFKSGSWTFYIDSHVTDPKCPYCGNQCYSGLFEYPNASSYRWQQYSWEYMDCSSCGAFNCRLNGNFSLIPGARNYSTHSTKTVTENILTCTKELGSYYDSNGNKCSCICDKIVNTISAVAPEQILRPGEAINNKVTLGLYNGQTVANYSCDVSGFNATDHSGNWQTVTLTTRTSDYPYSINGSGKREAGAKSVQIRVKILKPTYNVRAVDTEGGKIVFCPEGNETFVWITSAEGDKVVGKVLAEEGYFTEKLLIDGREVMLQPEDNGFEFIMPAHDVLVTASFRRSECKVRFDPKGGNWAGYEDIYETTAHYGKTYISEHVFPMDPVREGYVFTGWKNDKGKTVEQTDVCTSAAEELYACWRKVSNEIREVKFEEEIPWLEPIDIKGFLWNRDSFWRVNEKNGNGAGTAVKKGTILRNTGEYSLFGHWEPLSYSLYFDPVGGRVATGEKRVFYHTRLGELPEVLKNGAFFNGWYTDKKDGVKVTSDNSMTWAGNITLYARWDEKGDKLLAEGEVTEVNNDPVKKRTADNTAVTKAGERLGIRMNFRIPGEWKAPYKVVLTPEYLIKNKETGEYEEAHIFSTGVVDDKMLTFYERGLRDEDVLRTELKEKEAEVMAHWVLPYLSYCVRDENYGEMKEYSKVNTLSGEEDFFEKDCTLKTVFNAEISDASGKMVKVKDMIRVIITLE